MNDGFLKAAALSPALRVADCAYNAGQIAAQMAQCAARGVKLAVFPELALTGYTCGDLFFQQALQQAALDGLGRLLKASEGLDLVALVGLPLAVNGKLYNCAAALCGGRLLGLVPKTCLPNYGEFYEKRHFAPGEKRLRTVTVCGQAAPFGTQLLFRCRQMPAFVLGVELCEDLWSALPPSTFHALAGATVIANLSASDETVGKAEYRRALVANQSARLLCGYLYASAGHGESTQDMVFAGHDLVAENGAVLAETEPFRGGWAESELDCARMLAERARNTSFVPQDEGYQTVEFDLAVAETALTRYVDPAPFVPGDARRRAERCELILRMQTDGLAKRIEHTHAKTAVIGISGGLDSCLALLVAARAMRQLGRPAADVLAVTMPCFGTTKRTRSNAELLCQELGVAFREVNITDTVRSHFADIGHDGQTPDVTFENSQARVRTLELMDIANLHGGFVVGTGESTPACPRPWCATWCATRPTPPLPRRCARCCWTSWTRPSRPSCCPPRTARSPSAPRSWWAPMSCTTSTFIMCCASALARARSSAWPGRPSPAGPSTRTRCCTSGCAASTGAFSRSSSSAAACPTGPRWAA